MCAQVNLLAVDTNNIVNFCPGGAWVLLEGMQLAVTLGALYLILGVAATGGLVVCVATLPLNLVVMRRVKVLQDRLMREKDDRMALLSEAVGSIRTLKLHAWEAAFEERIAALRRKEVATLLHFQVLNAITSTLWLTAPTMAGLASFLVKSLLLKQTITPAEVRVRVRVS